MAFNGGYKDRITETRHGWGSKGAFTRVHQEFGWRETLRW